jgi:hypothetical protein
MLNVITCKRCSRLKVLNIFSNPTHLNSERKINTLYFASTNHHYGQFQTEGKGKR